VKRKKNVKQTLESSQHGERLGLQKAERFRKSSQLKGREAFLFLLLPDKRKPAAATTAAAKKKPRDLQQPK
jgi:hypothetical protein